MSNPTAILSKISSITPHPNADTLSIVEVSGFHSIVKTGIFTIGDECVFIYPDSILPDMSWAAPYTSKSKRVRAVKIRGIYSQGIVEPKSTFNDLDILIDSHPEMSIGDIIGVMQPCDAMAPVNDVYSPLSHYLEKTDETRWEVLANRSELPFGQPYESTLKIDGQSCTWIWIYNRKEDCYNTLIASRTQVFKPSAYNNYTRAILALDRQPLESYLRSNGNLSIALRGEVYGNGVQRNKINPHQTKPLSISFYSAWSFDEFHYFNLGHQHYFRNICDEASLPAVPIVSFDSPVITQSLLHEIEDKTDLVFEGCVIKHASGSFKVINKQYDSCK